MVPFSNDLNEHENEIDGGGDEHGKNFFLTEENQSSLTMLVSSFYGLVYHFLNPQGASLQYYGVSVNDLGCALKHLEDQHLLSSHFLHP